MEISENLGVRTSFPTILKRTAPLLLEVSANSKEEFSSNGKRPKMKRAKICACS